MLNEDGGIPSPPGEWGEQVFCSHHTREASIIDVFPWLGVQ